MQIYPHNPIMAKINMRNQKEYDESNCLTDMIPQLYVV